jgi:hypothetical protein
VCRPAKGIPRGSRPLLFSPQRRADFSLPACAGEVPAAEAPASSLFPLHLRFPDGGEPVRIGLGPDAPEWSERTLDFTVSAATNLVLQTLARPFEVAGCDPIPLPRTPPVPATGLSSRKSGEKSRPLPSSPVRWS